MIPVQQLNNDMLEALDDPEVAELISKAIDFRREIGPIRTRQFMLMVMAMAVEEISTSSVGPEQQAYLGTILGMTVTRALPVFMRTSDHRQALRAALEIVAGL